MKDLFEKCFKTVKPLKSVKFMSLGGGDNVNVVKCWFPSSDLSRWIMIKRLKMMISGLDVMRIGGRYLSHATRRFKRGSGTKWFCWI